jgi:hypothetical protein
MVMIKRTSVVGGLRLQFSRCAIELQMLYFPDRMVIALGYPKQAIMSTMYESSR